MSSLGHLGTQRLSPVMSLMLCLVSAAVGLGNPDGSGNEAPSGQLGPFAVSAVRSHREQIKESSHAFDITMGGTVDMDNTMSRDYIDIHVAFQPMLAVSIANTGDVPVVNPRLAVNDRGRWFSIEEIAQEALKPGRGRTLSNDEKALLLWNFVRSNTYHQNMGESGSEMHDPVRILSVWGCALCGDRGYALSALARAANLAGEGQGKPYVRSLHGHMMSEVYYDGKRRFLEVDEEAIYWDRENQHILSGDEIAQDHELAKREHTQGTVFRTWVTGERAAALFGSDDGAATELTSGHRMDLTLRPGEAVCFRWGAANVAASNDAEHDDTLKDDVRFRKERYLPPYYGDSQLRFEPRLGEEDLKRDAYEMHRVSAASGQSPVGEDAEAFLVYKIQSPWAICGGDVQAEFVGNDPKDCFTVAFSRDGKKWTELWSRTGGGTVECRTSLDTALAAPSHGRRETYQYFVRIGLGAASKGTASLRRLLISTDIVTAPLSLPRLTLGENHIEYSDQTDQPHEVEVVYRWRESDNVKPPAPPATPVFPEDGQTVRRSTFNFKWQETRDADRYQIRVSRYPDMMLPYRVSFDLVVEGNEHGSPYQGMFSPGEDYYWRVRARNKQNVWGPWSPVWRFRWEGPRVPVEVRCELTPDGQALLTWQPNPRGPKPVAYEIYASDERGFNIAKTPYKVVGAETILSEEAAARRGKAVDLYKELPSADRRYPDGVMPANFIAETKDARFPILSRDGSKPERNRCYWRVVAVDANGTASGPSAMAELPHPYIFTLPPKTAVAGQRFEYQPKTVRSLGDFLYRYGGPVGEKMAYWEQEGYRWSLAEKPRWLSIDSRTGRISGTPGPDNVGLASIEVVAERTYPYEPSGEENRSFRKAGPEFQAQWKQAFTIEVKPSR